MVVDLVTWIVVGLVALGLVLYLVGLYNTLVRMATANNQALANIDSVLRQRHEEITKLVNACQAYMEHERDTLVELTRMRTGAEGAKGTDARIQAENLLTRQLGKLRVVWEAYPALRASDNFLQAQERMSALETTLNDRREFFNASATEYNTFIRQFPPLVFAPLFGFRARPLLETPEEKRADIPQPFPLKNA
ncbi:MAG: LemA family protein [Pseudomonadota bacterium]